MGFDAASLAPKERGFTFSSKTLCPFELFNLNFMEHYPVFLLVDVLVIHWVFEQWVRFGAARFLGVSILASK